MPPVWSGTSIQDEEWSTTCLRSLVAISIKQLSCIGFGMVMRMLSPARLKLSMICPNRGATCIAHHQR